jgi:hypothetical protein
MKKHTTTYLTEEPLNTKEPSSKPYAHLALKPYEKFWQEFQEKTLVSREELQHLAQNQMTTNYSSPLS